MSGTIQERITTAERELMAVQKRLETLKAIDALLQQPGAREMMIDVIGPVSDDDHRRHRIQTSGGATAFGRLQSWFHKMSNTPASIVEMAVAAKVSVSAIRQIVYRTRTASFCKTKAEGGREMLFCLADKGESEP